MTRGPETPKIDRRSLLKLGLSASVVASMPLGCVVLDSDETDALLEHIGDSELPLNPDRTGVITGAEFERLATLCRYVDRTWELGADLDIYLQQLQTDLEFKTKETPSYWTEYQHGVELIELVDEKSKSLEETWTTLLFTSFDVEAFEHTKLGRARRFVFAEIITHQIPISGAFKSFGLWNYAGYFGGAYTEPTSYRR